ncbi:MAG TPA: ACT domain-containing protein, partial [Acidimicrobiales bacterium]|nr:ACT domain-containing protein [Acidimicrobiales bacterium]
MAGQGDRLIEVEWDEAHSGSFLAAIEVKALDRRSLLGDVSSAFASLQINILSSTTRTTADRVCKMHFDVELGDPSHLDSVISSIKGIESVYDAYRVLPGS